MFVVIIPGFLLKGEGERAWGTRLYTPHCEKDVSRTSTKNKSDEKNKEEEKGNLCQQVDVMN